ncbi:MACPF domain-containing protein At4g24290-like isoform X1 [Glycine soja]|uniref:MACPF domain-containing protein At4g24290-like isoform X1 n=1 Tax=Glycine soja TaxID=3848 RepID=UPI00103FC8E8|nr:MACPF domain-containing protein At4g24290-like isoform X1 [Glycine soja]XP_028194600.1 MACPF domain-containing protein At4g24290-like isoform X1 [Glycine soja]XP_028194602.1 MACPF domain-containing protein At4g24290-like isoform X1 [Glycine soja]XP_028194603.1 MACPF domain-containing protein At4g24290-like isoform X1 [Glycine soja]XP_028194604.1 MACPF domain-containing protein At4g24290-like isoform X1 [Glycine soja]
MALKVSAGKAAEIAIGSIGRGYDISTDIRLKYCKGDSINSRLIEIDETDVREVVLPGGVSIPNVSKSIKCDKGERIRFRSDVLSFQQMSEQFNQELSLTGKIPSGLFNTMFEFSGSWQRDAAHTKSLAFDGVLITLYTVALEKSQMVLCDHVKKAVPSSWDPPALARFIDTFGTHIIVGMKMGGKDVIYLKQQHSSTLQPADVQKKLKEMADRRFLDANGHYSIASDQVFPNDKFGIREQRLTFANISPSSSYSHKEQDIVSICKRRGGRDDRNLSHNEWLQTVQSEPDVISMSFIPITSVLNGVPGSGFLSHAINLYLRYKPPIVELHQFLEFQLPRQWAPVFSDLPLGPQRKQRSSASLQFSFMGPKLYVNSTQVDVGKRPVTGLRLYLEGKKSNRLAIHLQHLSSLPKIFQLEDDPNENFWRKSYDRRFYEKVQWKNFSHVCTAPVESEEDLSIVTGAQLQVENYGIKNILFLRLRFSTVLGAKAVKHPEWEGSLKLGAKSGLISTLISQHFTSTFQKPPPRPADVNINSAVYPGGPPVPVQAPKLLKFVDTTEMTRGPQESPGYWVISGAKLVVDKGKISLRVKYSLLTMVLPDEEEMLDDQ